MTISRLLCFVLLLAAIPATASETDRHAASAFLVPHRRVRLAAGEPGLVARVAITRGSRVRAGEVVVELDRGVLLAQRRIAEAEAADTAAVDAKRVELELAERRLQRMRELSRDGLGSDEELTQAEGNRRVAQLQWQAAEQARQRAGLRMAEVDARLAARQVVSPIDGVVTEVQPEAGEFLSAADPQVAEVVDISRLRASFYVSTAVAVTLATGSRVAMRLPETDQTATGTIEYVSELTRADSGRVRVDVTLDNADGRYRSGLRCTVPAWTLTAQTSRFLR